MVTRNIYARPPKQLVSCNMWYMCDTVHHLKVQTPFLIYGHAIMTLESTSTVSCEPNVLWNLLCSIQYNTPVSYVEFQLKFQERVPQELENSKLKSASCAHLTDQGVQLIFLWKKNNIWLYHVGAQRVPECKDSCWFAWSIHVYILYNTLMCVLAVYCFLLMWRRICYQRKHRTLLKHINNGFIPHFQCSH